MAVPVFLLNNRFQFQETWSHRKTADRNRKPQKTALLYSANSLRTEIIVHALGCSGNFIDSGTLTGAGTYRQRLPAFYLNLQATTNTLVEVAKRSSGSTIPLIMHLYLILLTRNRVRNLKDGLSKLELKVSY